MIFLVNYSVKHMACRRNQRRQKKWPRIGTAIFLFDHAGFAAFGIIRCP
jgi:hypothetical protein